MLWLVILAIEAGILMVLLQSLNDNDVDFLPAAGFALFASIVTSVLSVALVAACGELLGLLLAGLAGAVVVGLAVALIFGGELKRSVMIGGIFVACHFGISLLFRLMMTPAA